MFAGIDLGASSLKISLIQPGRPHPLARASQPIATSHPRSGWAEQQPRDWHTALAAAWGQLDPKLSAGVEAIAVSAGAHIAVLLDAANQPLRPAILWSDQRAAPQASRLLAQQGTYILATTGNQVQPTWTLAMLCWLREHQPQVLQGTRLCFAKDYLRMLLGGDWCTDPSDAQGSMLAGLDGRWDAQLASLAGLHSAQLPPVLQSKDVAGCISHAAARRFGIPQGVPLYCGCIDTSSELLPLACRQPGDQALKLASAGVWSRLTDGPNPAPPLSLYPWPLGWYHASGGNNCAAALRWATELLGADFAELDRAIARLLANPQQVAGAPLFHPYLFGERAPIWDNNASATLRWLNHTHQRDDLLYACAEGVAMALRHIRDVGGFDRNSPVSILGGLSHLPHLVDLLARLLGQPLRCSMHHDASLGSAMLAIAAVQGSMPRPGPYTLVQNQPADWLEARYQAYGHLEKTPLKDNRPGGIR